MLGYAIDVHPVPGKVDNWSMRVSGDLALLALLRYYQLSTWWWLALQNNGQSTDISNVLESISMVLQSCIVIPSWVMILYNDCWILEVTIFSMHLTVPIPLGLTWNLNGRRDPSMKRNVIHFANLSILQFSCSRMVRFLLDSSLCPYTCLLSGRNLHPSQKLQRIETKSICLVLYQIVAGCFPTCLRAAESPWVCS